MVQTQERNGKSMENQPSYQFLNTTLCGSHSCQRASALEHSLPPLTMFILTGDGNYQTNTQGRWSATTAQRLTLDLY